TATSASSSSSRPTIRTSGRGRSWLTTPASEIGSRALTQTGTRSIIVSSSTPARQHRRVRNTLRLGTLRALNTDSTGRTAAPRAAVSPSDARHRRAYGLTMTTTARLERPTVQLTAGTVEQVPLQIRNDGEIVEGYRIEVLGVPGAWTSVEPAEITGLFPGAET